MDEINRMGTVIGTILNEFKKQHSKHLNEKCSWEVDFLLRYLDRERIIFVERDVAIDSLQRAHFHKAFPDYFELVEKEDGLYLVWDPAKNEEIKKPKIKRRNPITPALRHEVFKRDNYRCLECGATNKNTRLHVDHIIPVSQGGSDEFDNLQTLCEECNLAKGNRAWKGGE